MATTLAIILSHTTGVLVGVVSSAVGLGLRLVSMTTGVGSGTTFTSCGGTHGDEVKVTLITAGSMTRGATGIFPPLPDGGSSSRPGFVLMASSRHSKAADTSASCVAASIGVVPANSSTQKAAKAY